MKLYFPSLYKDEYLFSVIARYLAHTGDREDSNIIGEMFRLQKRQPGTVHLTQFRKIDAFCKNLTSVNAPTSIELLHKTYYLQLTKAICIEAGFPQESVNAEELFGSRQMLKLKGMNSDYLRFCKYCMEDQMCKLGESYWLGKHQFRDLTYCYDHGVKLNETTIPNNISDWMNNRYNVKFLMPHEVTKHRFARYDDRGIHKDIQMRMLEFIITLNECENLHLVKLGNSRVLFPSCLPCNRKHKSTNIVEHIDVKYEMKELKHYSQHIQELLVQGSSHRNFDGIPATPSKNLKDDIFFSTIFYNLSIMTCLKVSPHILIQKMISGEESNCSGNRYTVEKLVDVF